MGKITSKEIAKLAGVSVSTVSIVLNSKPGVSAETREQILAILASYGIFPKTNSPVAKRSFIRFCKIVKHGQIINDRHNVFISEYIDGVVEEAKALGLSVEVSTYQDVPLAEIASDLAKNTENTGCILLSTEFSEEDLAVFSSLSVPHVFLDAIFPFSNGAFVTMDNYGMVAEALRYLQECGHTRIGMLTSSGCSNFTARQDAYIASMKRLGFGFDPALLVPVHSTHLGSYEDTKAYLGKVSAADLPTAFFACNDIVALGAIRALEECGYEVPAKVSVIGFDDLPISSLLSPALTTLSVPKFALGKLAVRVLLNDWSLKTQVESQKSILGGTLIRRSSVQCIG